MALAIGALMISCGEKTASDSSYSETPVADPVATTPAGDVQYNGQIVYIQIDSILRSYGMAMDLQAEFEEKSNKAQNELNSKGRSLERDARDYQDKASKGLITRSQAADMENSLAQRQQSLMEFREQKLQELSEEENVMMNKISNAIMEFVKEYNAKKGYSMIISSTGANTVLIADPALNITAEVLDGLNEEYKTQLK